MKNNFSIKDRLNIYKMFSYYNLIWGIPIALIAVMVSIGLIYRRMSGRCTSKEKMTGKTVIVTGGNSGIGYYAALDLAARGARVILACRSKAKAEEARDSIIKHTQNESVLVRLVDFSDLDSVRNFAKEILDTETRLDVLINNAGNWSMKRTESTQGFELTLATNHYGHFLLTVLLIDLLKRSKPSRIINVSSLAHKFYHLDFDDLHFKKRKYSRWNAYCQSKLCNILFTKELSHRLIGSGVTANSLHPGTVATPITDKEGTFLGTCHKIFNIVVGKTAELGAQTTIYLAVSSDVAKVSGEYFVDCQLDETSRKARDPGLAKQLWEITEEEVGLSEEEKAILALHI